MPEVSASGRTDAGVHAKGQVVSFAWPESLGWSEERLREALNGISPPGLQVKSLVRESNSFDARRAAHLKCYTYRFALRNNRACAKYERAWAIESSPDVVLMAKAARILRGDHDFSGFRAKNCCAKSTLRTIYASEVSRPEKDLILFTIIGKGFLKQMVRIIAGTLLKVGDGAIDIAKIEDILDSGKRSAAGPTAPASGLTLEWVRYL